MYATPRGERTLRGAERRLFTSSLAMITDMLSEGDYVTGVSSFDSLQRNQKIAVLHMIAQALLREDVPPVPLTAAIEAAVAVVYRNVEDQIAAERHFGESEAWGEEAEWDQEESRDAGWRTRIWNAYREAMPDNPRARPDDMDEHEWSFLLESLQECVLWDNDWEMVEHQDLAPEHQRRLKQEMGIADDYFVWIPPDPRDDDAEKMLRELEWLTPEGRGLNDSSGNEPLPEVDF